MLLTRIVIVVAFIAVVALLVVLNIPEVSDEIFVTATPRVSLVTREVLPTVVPVDYTQRNDFRGMVVVPSVLHVREFPSLESRVIGSLTKGQVVEWIPPLEQFEADNYLWVKHTLGWSARSSDAGHVLLQELGTVGTLFVAMPIDMRYVAWAQPFGDTVQARRFHQETYEYSNGLHGGIDFGVDIEGVPVYAATGGVVINTTNTGVRLSSPPYTVIYEHLSGIPSGIKKGDSVDPSTFIGTVDFSDPKNAHLHLEVRYDKHGLIINPGQLLPVINWGNIRWQNYPGDAKYRDPRYQAPIELSE